MKVAGILGRGLPLLLAAVPGYLGAGFLRPLQSEDSHVFGVLLVFISATSFTGEVLRLKLRPPQPSQEVPLPVSACFGVALLAAAVFFYLSLMKLMDVMPEMGFVRWILFGLAYLSLAAGIASLVDTIPPCNLALFPEPFEAIDVPEMDENLPVVPPEPNLQGLLRVKQHLKASGRT